MSPPSPRKFLNPSTCWLMDMQTATVKVEEGLGSLYHARLTWQQLLDIYRRNDGDLGSIFSLLVELEWINDKIKQVLAGNKKHDLSYVWMMPQQGYTTRDTYRRESMVNVRILITPTQITITEIPAWAKYDDSCDRLLAR